MANVMMEDLRSKEAVVFSVIPGMNELLCASPDTIQEIQIQYPDAAFAVQVANNLFDHNRELSIPPEIAHLDRTN